MAKNKEKKSAPKETEAAKESAENKVDTDNKEQKAQQESEDNPMEKLQQRCDEFEKKASEASDKYLRLAAEFDNFRRRSAKDRLDLINTAGEDIIVGFLPIIDDCERALQVLKDSDVADAAKEGTELIMNKLIAFLKTRGVEKIEALGQELNTDFHEAVAQFPTDDKKKKNKIIDIIQQGYTLHGKVIRYAKVVVGV